MACPVKTLWKLLVFLLVSNFQHCADGKPQVPCFFIFGDSAADNGNNNNLSTTIKANYPPYGIDFPNGPTGRFTNGRTSVDFIAEYLGFDKYIPPFATARGQEILQGVNYASGAAGIRNETGHILGDRISMDRQLKNHQTTVSRIVNMLGNQNSATEYLSKCIYSVEIGSNDYFNNYFIPLFYPAHDLYTPSQYAGVLIEQFSQQLKTLHKYGARKVVVFGQNLPDCTLFKLAICGINFSPCMDNISNTIQLFNDRLISLVADLNNNLTNSNFIFINATGISLSTSNSQGPTENFFPCCQVLGVGFLSVQCKPHGNSCSNRSHYAVWDAVHLSEAAYALHSRRAYRAQSPSDAYPFDIEHLARL